MATSGTVTFRSNRDAIINGSLRLVGAYDPENVSGPTANQVTNAAEALNQMTKSLESVGLYVESRRYGVVFPQKSQGLFVLGSPGPAGDHACLSSPVGAGFVQTTLSASAASGASTITVTSSSGLSTVGITAAAITNGYTIGVELDSGSVQWTTVNGAPSGLTVTLTAVLTGAATAGNNVFCYQTKLVRPLRILDAWCHQLSGDATGYPTSGGNKIPIRVISKDEWNRFGSNSSGSTPTQLAYDAQSNSGTIMVYPNFGDAKKLLYIEFTKPIEDFAASADDFDLAQEWGETLKFMLALRIAPEYEVPREKYNQIKDQAGSLFLQVSGYNQEPASVMFQPSSYIYE